jgi:spore coat protein A
MPASTDFWSYNQMVPGPVIVSKTGQQVRVQFHNELGPDDSLPFESYDSAVDVTKGMDHTGSNTANPKTQRLPAFKIRPCTVTHLHGAPSQADSDGWAENMTGAGETSEKLYQFPRETYTLPGLGAPGQIKGGASPTFWYHDHAMGITRYNVYAGLAGMWLVRDELEEIRGLPCGNHEIPLVIQDRNFETKEGTVDGELTGQLLHKIHTDYSQEPPDKVMEAFAPATLVNGLLWPKCLVGPHLHRLRIVNGSNARFYRLHFMGIKDAIPEQNPSHPFKREPLTAPHILQIGTDGGLLGKAIGLTLNNTVSETARYLLLAPGERADVLLDCGRLVTEGYKHIEVINSAPSPYGGEKALDGAVGDANPDGLLPYPAVMRFDFVKGEHDSKPVQITDLDHNFHRITHDEISDHDEAGGHDHLVIALREEEVEQKDPKTGIVTKLAHLFMHEMMPIDKAPTHCATTPDLKITLRKKDTAGNPVGTPTVYVSVAKHFDDAVNIMLKKGAWAAWKIINLSPDTHPFHIHLVQFQGLSRVLLEPTDVPYDPVNSEVELSEILDPQAPDGLDENERGWKDTIRVNPGVRQPVTDFVMKAEMLTLAAQFTGHAGRYMYHCHILEHEDREMMRPFVVLPGFILDQMSGHSSHGGHMAPLSPIAPPLAEAPVAGAQHHV